MAKKKALPTVTVATDKKKALDQALAQIEKQHGKNAVMFLGQEVEQEDKDVISTGSIGLDMALGIGGLPRGRIIEIYGPESSGKTTVALHSVAEAQKLGGTAALRRLTTPNTRWIRRMRRRSALTWTACWYRSRTAAIRAWKLPNSWCARARWISSSLTR